MPFPCLPARIEYENVFLLLEVEHFLSRDELSPAIPGRRVTPRRDGLEGEPVKLHVEPGLTAEVEDLQRHVHGRGGAIDLFKPIPPAKPRFVLAMAAERDVSPAFGTQDASKLRDPAAEIRHQVQELVADRDINTLGRHIFDLLEECGTREPLLDYFPRVPQGFDPYKRPDPVSL